jgi:AcrR family transcriptional regulator
MTKGAGRIEEVGQAAQDRDGGNKGERTRARVKTAFCELLTHKSFASITISDICRTAEITVGGLYFHFANQDELLNEVMWEYADALGRALDRAMKEDEPERVATAVCGALVSAYQERNGLARTFQQLTRTRADYAARWRAITGPRIAQLAAILSRQRPDLSALKATFLAHALITLVVSQLDLAYVYVDRHRAATAATTLTKNLVTLWHRMVDVRKQAA